MAVKKVIKIMTGDIIFGNMESVDGPGGKEILVKQPFQAKDGNIMPYGVLDLGSAPAAIQIHPMNIVWSAPLDDFPDVEKAYVKATSGIELESKPSLIV